MRVTRVSGGRRASSIARQCQGRGQARLATSIAQAGRSPCAPLTLSPAFARSYLDVPSCSARERLRAGAPFRVPSRLSMTAPAAAPDDVLTWIDVVLRLLAATGIGGAIGLNRELTRKPAG